MATHKNGDARHVEVGDGELAYRNLETFARRVLAVPKPEKTLKEKRKKRAKKS
jgi:hypothetical protein